jgi:hypothetical protein
MLEALAAAFAPWQSLYSDSVPVSTAVTAVHILALLVGGGLAIAADRSTLRALRHPAPHRAAQLYELHAVHRPVLMALGVLFVSGFAMAAADVEVFAASTFFWVKMGLVAMMLLNGALLYWTEARLLGGASTADGNERLWRRLRLTSQASLALWAMTTVAGAVLPSVA